jgi:hypothetical protein
MRRGIASLTLLLPVSLLCAGIAGSCVLQLARRPRTGPVIMDCRPLVQQRPPGRLVLLYQCGRFVGLWWAEDQVLRGMDLRGQILPLSRFNVVCFYNLDLRDTDLRGVDLHGVHLTRCDLRGADLRGANLAGATYDRATRWPAGFDQ